MIMAESKLYAERGGGRRASIVFRVGGPEQDPLGSVCCKVHLRGIDPPRKIHGEDSLQALSLAFAFIHLRVRALQAEGWQFYFGPRDREPFDLLSAWFPNYSEPKSRKPVKRARVRSRTAA
jgi:hypothetical protein